MGWYAKPGMVKMFISTFSTTTPGSPHEVMRTSRSLNPETNIWESVSTIKSTPRPKVIEDIFKNINAIDMNDRYRQGYLQMEVFWNINVKS